MSEMRTNYKEPVFQPDDFTFEQMEGRIYDKPFEGKPIGFFMDAWLRFRQNKAAVISTVIILLIVLMAIFAPMFAPYSFRDIHTSFGILPPRIPGLENLGIFDGSATIELRAAQLGDYEDSLMEILEETRPEIDFENETALIDNQLLDSFDCPVEHCSREVLGKQQIASSANREKRPRQRRIRQSVPKLLNIIIFNQAAAPHPHPESVHATQIYVP